MDTINSIFHRSFREWVDLKLELGLTIGVYLCINGQYELRAAYVKGFLPKNRLLFLIKPITHG